jgi:hypothetical protein
MNDVVPVVEAPAPSSQDKHVEYLQLRRVLSFKQRKLLAALPEHGSIYAAGKAVGISSSRVWHWKTKDVIFQKVLAHLEEQSLDELGITHAYILGKTKEVIERCMQAEPVRGRDGKIIEGEYQFREQGALRGLEKLGEMRKLWGPAADKAQSAQNIFNVQINV